MKTVLSTQWLYQTSYDSAAPSGGAVVVHRFTAPGEYRVRFVDGEATLAETLLAVTPETPSRIAAQHTVLDLTTIAYPKNLGDTVARREHVFVRPEGYVSFTDSGKAKPFAVVAESLVEKSAAFDTRRLVAGDVFAVTLLRPGEYRVVNELSRAEGRITVAFPVVGDRPYRPPEPLTVDCTDAGFQPHAIDLKPAQGLIFRLQTPSRVKIDLVRPDDGPGESRERTGPVAKISRERVIAALERLRESRKKE